MAQALIRRRALVLAIALLVVLGSLLLARSSRDGYRVQLVMPQAAGVFPGMKIRLANATAGSVTEVAVRDGKAVVEVRIDDGKAPLREGTRPVVNFRSVPGEVYLDLEPGPDTAPALPDGAMIATDWSQVTVEDVLETLDPKTRKRLSALLAKTDRTLGGGTAEDLSQTLAAAGPAVEALGEVLQALGQDGPAMHTMVAKLSDLVSAAASRREALTAAVSALAGTAEEVAARRDQLAAGLSALPGTLDQAQATLSGVRPAVEAATPLVEDLRPAAAELPGVAAQLHPVLADLQPTARSLRSTLRSANILLGETPSLLDSVHATAPGLDRALAGLAPALSYLRPYTPDLVGWLTNWAGVFAPFTSQGHAGHLLATVSATGVNNLPKITIPGMTIDGTTAPGTSAGQPWTDASGGELK